MEYIKPGTLVQFKYSKNGKWHDGRVDRVQPEKDSKLVYSVQVYGNHKRLNMDDILEGIEKGRDRNFIDMGDKPTWIEEEGWYFIRWFSPEYVREKIIHVDDAKNLT